MSTNTRFCVCARALAYKRKRVCWTRANNQLFRNWHPFIFIWKICIWAMAFGSQPLKTAFNISKTHWNYAEMPMQSAETGAIHSMSQNSAIVSFCFPISKGSRRIHIANRHHHHQIHVVQRVSKVSNNNTFVACLLARKRCSYAFIISIVKILSYENCL